MEITPVARVHWGNMFAVIVDIKGSDSYTAGGETVGAGDVGLESIDFALFGPAVDSENDTALSAAYDYGEGKVQFFETETLAAAGKSAMVEVAATTDISAFSARAAFVGH